VVYCQNLGGYTLETWRRAASAERWKHEDRGAERRGVLGRGCRPPPPPQPTRGSGGRHEHSRHISGPQNPSSRNNALRNQPKIWARFGGPVPPGPSLKPPLLTAPKPFDGFLKNFAQLITSATAPYMQMLGSIGSKGACLRMREVVAVRRLFFSFLFSRSYCYTVWSAIGIILLSVCPSVRLSVCDAVHCGSQGWCTRLKVVPTCS